MTSTSAYTDQHWIPYGRLGKTHGVFGALRVYPDDHPLVLHNQQTILLEHTASQRRTEFEICSVRRHPAGYLVELSGISTVEAARTWVGSQVSIERSELPEIQPGEFYYFQLLQAEVVDADGTLRGHIQELQNNAGQILATVKTPNGNCLIPLADEFLISFDREAKRCVLDVPAALWGDIEPLVAEDDG